MTRSKRFSSELKIAEAKKRNAARVAVQAKQKLHEYEGKLDELRSFRSDYAIAVKGVDNNVTASLLQERQKFIQQLDEGIKVIQNRIEGQKQSTEIDKQAWMDAHKHSDAMDKLMLKIKKIEIDLIETRAENEIDDRSQYRKVRN